MTTKNLGAGVSGYLDPDSRAWETTVYQAGKPVLDKELNLVQDSQQEAELRLRKRSLPSGWIADDYLNTSNMSDAYFVAAGSANDILVQDIRAHVNGWIVHVNNTNRTAAGNLLNLGAGPAGAGTKRTDLVILEVWRRLLSASPSTVGKSPSGRIWLYGNVKIQSSDDLTLNLADDILDGAVGSETTKRVQIQYRIRVIQGVDVFAFPSGIDDPTVLANTVPPNAATPDGSATAFNYANQSGNNDPGLWRAGDGNPANTLGTVDGYMYAIPLLAAIRRNTTAFDRNTNHNGGSGRPDGLLVAQIVARDIVDLRNGVSPNGWNYNEVLAKNFNWLLDNVLQTELTQTNIGGGVQGHTHIWADEIGITNAHGGDGITTGDTPGAAFIGEFDAVRRRFSDRTTVETMTVKFNPPGANWVNGDTLVISPTALAIYPYAAFNWASFAPSGVAFIDMTRAMFLGNGNTKRKANISANFNLSGMGAVPVSTMQLSIGTVPAGITNEPLYVTFAVMYPPGCGLTKTPVADFGFTNTVFINNPSAMPAGGTVLYEAIDDIELDYPHRELYLVYRTVAQTISYSWGTGLNDIIHFPERVRSWTTIVINGVTYGGGTTLSDDGYSIQLNPGSFTSGEVTITYKALRPFPQNGEQVTVYYDARAPQTSRDAVLGTTIGVTPRAISQQLYTLTIGSGSQDEAYPFPFQYVQQPGVYPTSGGTFQGDHRFEGSGEILLESLTVNTGYIQLPVTVGYVPNPQEAIFNRIGGDVDAEGRSYFKSVSSLTYIPNAFAQPLKVGSKTRRTLLPMLAELQVDSSLGREGQLVMLVLGTYYETSATESWDNAVAFDTNLTNNRSSVSVYRIKGNLLNRRSV